MTQSLNIYNLAKFISTVGFIGLIKIAPGTFGSMVAFPLSLGLVHFARYLSTFKLLDFTNLQNIEQEILLIFSLQLFVIVALFVIGVYASDYYAGMIEKNDPKEVVIDEVVGQLLVINFCFLGYFFISSSKIGQKLSPDLIMLIFLVVLPFVLFRLFDIFKPWPINWLDQNIKGGIGIMLDDIGAAIFATVIYYVVIFVLLDFFG